jgi:hypothetical protein
VHKASHSLPERLIVAGKSQAFCQTSSSTRGAGARLSNHRGMTSTLAYVYMRNGTTLRNVAAAPCNVHALVKGTAEASHHAL